jgi:hypothetical protein
MFQIAQECDILDLAYFACFTIGVVEFDSLLIRVAKVESPFHNPKKRRIEFGQ